MSDIFCSHDNTVVLCRPEQELLTFDDGQSAPLDLLPAAVDEPLVHLLHQFCQVVRVRLHDLVKFCKLSTMRGTGSELRTAAESAAEEQDVGNLFVFYNLWNTK